MSKPSQVIVIVEDKRHEQLIYRYLKHRKLRGDEFRFLKSPSGSGSAEKWVRATFVKEVSVYRNRQAKVQTALIVLIDADTGSIQHRLGQLDQALKDSGKKPVDPNGEHIARLVPKRNIETWILCLNGRAVDEETDYKRMSEDWSELIPQAAETLSLWRSRAERPEHCIESLQIGISELKRLEF